MKRPLIVILSVLLLVVMFVACNTDGVNKDKYETVSVSLNTGNETSSKDLASSYPAFDKDNFYWRYTAVKKDIGSKIGEKTSETNVKATGKGLGSLAGSFATGQWTFSLYAYNDSGFTKKVYAGSADVAFTGANAVETITISVGPLSEGSGTLVIGKFAPKSGTPTNTTQVAYIVGGTTNTSKTDFPTTITDLNSGIYTITIELSYIDGLETFKTASEPIQVAIYDNLTTTISGNVDDLTLHVNVDTDGPFTVTFDTKGGSTVGPQSVVKGGKATTPTDPTKEGCGFEGWYKETSCTNKWNFGTDTVTTNTTLYAKWTMGTKGSASISGSSGRTTCGWVQLWEDGPRWAEFNVGSTISSYEGITSYTSVTVGGLYTWGRTQDARDSYFTTYTSSDSDIQGTEDDTAKNLWGSNWAMPTISQLTSLTDSSVTTWTWCDGSNTTYTTGCSLKGFKITGKGDYTNNSIFLPAAGFYQSGIVYLGEYGYYWSSTPKPSENAGMFVFIANYCQVDKSNRGNAQSVRAILAEN